MAVTLSACGLVAKLMLQCNEAICCNFCLSLIQALWKQKGQQERRVGRARRWDCRDSLTGCYVKYLRSPDSSRQTNGDAAYIPERDT